MNSFLPLEEELLLCRLLSTPGIGGGLATQLLTNLPSIASLEHLSIEELQTIEGIGKELALRIQQQKDFQASHLKRWKEENIHLVSVLSSLYPKQLLKLPSPPALLFYQGCLDLLSNPTPWIAVVGTRLPNHDGLHYTEKTVQSILQKGWGVVSGGALGIDQKAHQVALDNQGKTLAFLGGGFHHLYPKENIPLFRKIREKNGIFSEFFPYQKPEKNFFPQRNRCIASLCKAVVVIQCKVKSGAMNTALHAMRLSIPVFTFPGRPHDELAGGPHELIRKGAVLIEKAEEIFSYLEEDSSPRQKELFQVVTKNEEKLFTSSQEAVLSFLQHSKASMETLREKVDLGWSDMTQTLLELELEGHIFLEKGEYQKRTMGKDPISFEDKNTDNPSLLES